MPYNKSIKQTNKSTSNKSYYYSNKKSNESTKQHYVYTLNLKGGKKYVGMTSDPEKRLTDHFTGNGAQWTQKNQPTSLSSIIPCKNKESARKLETAIYYNVKERFGSDKVRGAGNTKSY